MQRKSKYILAISLIFAATVILLFTFAIPIMNIELINPEGPIQAQSDESETPAIYGHNIADENGIAIIGRAEGANSTAIRGIGNFAVIGEGQMVGVMGTSRLPGGIGVSGIGQNGVYGESQNGAGIGIWGKSSKRKGEAIGVRGTAYSGTKNSKGVLGDGFYGIYGTCDSSDGYAGYFDGGKGLRIPVLPGDPHRPVEGTIWVNKQKQVMRIRLGGNNYTLRADRE